MKSATQKAGGQAAQRVSRRNRPVGPYYKWVVLSNTTLGVLMASIDASIVLISLPAIFKGIHINPLAPGETNYFLWILLGYMMVTATLLVTFGRISDMYGRVRFYNMGFAIFAVGSILLWLTPGTGNVGALELILFRFVQGIGAAFLFANSAAIITDAFPAHQRGLALGINQIAAIVGSVIGLILGGILSYFDWRLVFLVSVPVGIVGAIWAYMMLREVATICEHQKIDWAGNITFVAGATILLFGITYGIEPYGSAPTGWGNPLVIGALCSGVLLLAAFIWIELHVQDPMFQLQLFKIRMFAAGNTSSFLASIARGGLQFMLVIWLQGIWLPLHGYNYDVAPLWAGIYMIPLMVGFLLMGPLSGWLSDRYGARLFSTCGMLIQAAGFFFLTVIPLNFDYMWFWPILFLLGIGQGMFSITKHLLHHGECACRAAWSGVWYARDVPKLRFAREHWHLLQSDHGGSGCHSGYYALYWSHKVRYTGSSCCQELRISRRHQRSSQLSWVTIRWRRWCLPMCYKPYLLPDGSHFSVIASFQISSRHRFRLVYIMSLPFLPQCAW